MRPDIHHITWPQVGQRKLQSTTDDYQNIVSCQNFEQVMEHGFVLFLADYDEGYHVYDDTKHGKGQYYKVKHGSLKKLNNNCLDRRCKKNLLTSKRKCKV